MGANRTRSTYRGVVVPDPRVCHANLNASLSSYTEADPKPGIPVDGNAPRSAMVLEASGAQAASTTLEVRTMRGGFPGVSERSGGFIHRLSTASYWAGWDVPNTASGWEWLHRTSNAYGAAQPHVIRLLSGNAMSVNKRLGVDSVTRILPRVFDADTGTWTELDLLEPDDWGGANVADPYPCLCQLPSGRILLYYWLPDSVSDTAQIQMQFSDDEGVSWQIGSRYVLDAPIDTSTYDLRRIRVVYNAGQVLLVAQIEDGAQTYIEGLVQCASDDNGVRFSTVYTYDIAGGENGANPEILAGTGGGFVVLYQDTLNGAHMVKRRTLSSAFHSLGGETEVTALTLPLAGSDVQLDFAAWPGEDGAWYLVIRTAYVFLTSPAALYTYRSIDDGDAWSRLTSSTDAAAVESLFYTGGELHYLTGFSACEVRGRMVMLSQFVTDAGTYDDWSLLAVYAGGYTTLTQPALAHVVDDVSQQCWEVVWSAWFEPDQESTPDWGTVWAASTTGSPTVSFADEGMLVECDASNYRGWTRTLFLSSAVTDEGVFEFQGQFVEGGSATAKAMVAEMRVADGTDDYTVCLYFYDAASGPGGVAGYRVTDEHSGSAGTDVELDITQPFQIRVSITAGIVRVWHRLIDVDGSLLRDGWVAAHANTSLTSNTSSPASNWQVRWCGFAAGSGDTSMYWKDVRTTVNTAGFVGYTNGFTNPGDLFPRSYSRRPVSLHQGTRLAAVDGPTMPGEEWTLTTRSLYGVENIDPAIAPSPRRKWRTSAETQQVLVWDLSDVDDGLLTLGPGPFGLCLMGCNWRTASLYGRTAAGTDTKLFDIDLAAGFTSLEYSREGRILRPAGTTSDAAAWLHHHELAGATLDLDATDYLKVTTNSGGWWTDASNVEFPRVYCAAIDDSEGTSGSLDIWRPDGLFLLRVPPSPGAWRHLKLVIDAQTTADGYLETGLAMFGPAYIFGADYAWGRIVSAEANTAVTTRRAGTRYARKLGPLRRRAELAWTDGVDMTSVFALDPDFALAGTTSPAVVATPAATPTLLEGLLDYLGGPGTTLVYFATMDGTADSVVTLNRQGDFLYGRLSADGVRRETILGEEQDTELVRVAGIAIEQEV